MIEMILFVLMGTSIAGMLMFGFNDPLSRKFWDDLTGGDGDA